MKRDRFSLKYQRPTFGTDRYAIRALQSRRCSAFATAVRHTRPYHATLYRLGMLEKGYRMQLHTIAHPLP